MFKITIAVEFPEAGGLAALQNRPAEQLQLQQLIQFWATQFSIQVVPPVINEERSKLERSFIIPDQEAYDAILGHAAENGVDIYDVVAKLREFVEPLGGTVTRTDEDI